MKIINKIIIGIAVICLLLCGGILVFAMNPDMTDALAQRLYGNGNNAETATEGVTASGNTENTDADGNIRVTLPNGTPGEMNGYVAPAIDQLRIPEDVSSKNGFQPIQPEEQEVPDQEAQNLEDTLPTGDLGTDLTFSTEEYPYYQMLPEEQQAVYRQIYANAMELTARFAPERTVTAGDVKNAFEAVIGDHPELFWLETGYSGKYMGNGQCVEIDLKYNSTANDLENAKKSFDAAAQNLLSGAENLGSDYEKEKYIHDALAEAVTYDLAADRNQSTYSALVDGNSVCAGYARAYQYLLQQLGIPCYYCTGYSGGNHAWNIVKLDDGYYNVDVTWDDADTIRYNYFNKTDADFASTHVRQNLSVYLPACNGTAYRQESVAAGDGQQTNVVNGDGTVPDANGGEETTSAQPGNSLSDYINPNPQEPLRYPGGNTGSSDSVTAATPAPRSDAVTDLNSYYANCITQLSILGSGDQHFDNVVSKSLWSTIEQAYNTGAYEQGYVAEVLKKLGMENFVIQLQLVDLGDGYYRVYHNVVTY